MQGMVGISVAIVTWSLVWNLVLGQGFNSFWERPLALTLPMVIAYALSARWVDRLLPHRTLASDWYAPFVHLVELPMFRIRSYFQLAKRK